mmetsp:Transcript_65279/g.179132  ORF Transcript_65279/g.179132 Transcript_65279/m.179132 type:complete len:86 (-) Transcript_65279:22-279(-)
MMFNLTFIRGKTLQKLATICDKDGDGTVQFSEVRAECRVCANPGTPRASALCAWRSVHGRMCCLCHGPTRVSPPLPPRRDSSASS